MTEPDQIEFHERVTASSAKPGWPSLATRAGVVAGSAILVVVGVVAAMGASPAAPASSGTASLTGSAALAPATGDDWVAPLNDGFRGGRLGPLGFGDITIAAINGSNLSLKTEDGWTRTITVTSSTTITKGSQTIALGDLAVGDQIRFAQDRASDGTYSITAVHVLLPTVGGEVTAVSGNAITATGRDGATVTIHVDADTTYQVNGETGKALSDITVGSFVVAQGSLRSDGSLDADVVHSGTFGHREFGDGQGRGFPGMPGMRGAPDFLQPTATPTPATAS